MMEEIIKEIMAEVGNDTNTIIKKMEEKYKVKIGKGNRKNIEKLIKKL